MVDFEDLSKERIRLIAQKVGVRQDVVKALRPAASQETRWDRLVLGALRRLGKAGPTVRDARKWPWPVRSMQSHDWITALGWWEKRRWLYNLGVLPFGMLGLLLLALVLGMMDANSSAVDYEEYEFVPFLWVMFSALAANVLYCLGWFAEISVGRLFVALRPLLSPVLWMMGLAFSALLCFLPATFEFICYWTAGNG